MNKAIRIGLAGFGTVGSGTYAVLERNQHDLQRRAGCPLTVTRIACRTPARTEGKVSSNCLVSSDWRDIIDDTNIEVVIEVMGGIEPARTFILAAIDAGKHVITANKALLAHHGNEIFAAARQKGVMVMFEAAVAGGVPIIKTLREGLAANRIEHVAGIINGTSNYILSTMRDKGLAFEEVLADAQRLGYAEADPTFDIDGQDAAHKLCILASLAFGIPINFDACHIEGIRGLDPRDIAFAEELGYRIKLLGVTKRRDNGFELRVHPALVPKRRLIANVEGVMNSVVIKGDAVDSVLLYGRGAGAEPTASAVIADLVDVARMMDAATEHQVPFLGFRLPEDECGTWLAMGETVTSYYLRVRLADRAGVLADVTRIFAENDISIEALIQREAEPGSSMTDAVMLTHSAMEACVVEAIAAIEALDTVNGRVVMLRKEELN